VARVCRIQGGKGGHGDMKDLEVVEYTRGIRARQNEDAGPITQREERKYAKSKEKNPS